MWEPRPLTTPWALTAYYKDSFTFTFYIFSVHLSSENEFVMLLMILKNEILVKGDISIHFLDRFNKRL
jgi:hypothetical protein